MCAVYTHVHAYTCTHVHLQPTQHTLKTSAAFPDEVFSLLTVVRLVSPYLLGARPHPQAPAPLSGGTGTCLSRGGGLQKAAQGSWEILR